MATAAKTATKAKTSKTTKTTPTTKAAAPAKAKAAPVTKKAPVAAKAPAKPRAAAKPKATPTAGDVDRRRHYVEVAAYFIAERRGFMGGCEMEDWVMAESEIDRMLAEGKLSA